MPVQSLKLAVRSESYSAAMITRLKAEGYILLRSKDKLRGYSLKAKGKQYMLSHYPEDCSLYLSGAVSTNHIKSEPDKRLRLHRAAEIWAYFQKHHVPIRISQKPGLWEKRPIGQAYYGTLEYKSDYTKEMSGSRATGILFAGNRSFVIYNTMAGMQKWATKTELTMRAWVDRVARHKSCEEAQAIIFGSDLGLIKRIMESDGGIKNRYFKLDTTYEQFFFVPIWESTAIQLQLLVNEYQYVKLLRLIQQGLATKAASHHLHIGTDDQGYDVFICCLAELWNLKRMQRIVGTHSKVICFDYQERIMRELYPEARIETLSVEKVLKFLQMPD